jgi:hypothetical protein
MLEKYMTHNSKIIAKTRTPADVSSLLPEKDAQTRMSKFSFERYLRFVGRELNAENIVKFK